MASHESSLRLKFLQDSASLLRTQSTATAAHLMALHNHILHENSKTIKARQHKSWCGACGSPRKPSHTKVVKLKQRNRKEKTRLSLKGASNGAFVLKCLRCSRRTIQDRRAQTRVQPHQTSGVSIASQAASSVDASTSLLGSSTISSSTSEVSSRTTLENASSKKRAKARKQGGLQALLASKQRAQESKPSASSLDLFDFLQQ